MKRSALALATLLSACSAPPSTGERAQAIVNGTDDSGDPAVVMVLSQVPGSSTGSLCTAEIVSPHVVLTAAHCVSPDVVGQGAQFIVFIGQMLSQSAPKSDFLAVSETHFDPKFDPNYAQNNMPPTHDVGVVVLKNPTTIPPIPYNRTQLPQSMIGQAARYVGYGITSSTDTQGMTAGTRRTAPTKLSAIDTTYNLLGFEDDQHGICEGDSGGPAFMTINGKELIVGVTSFGFPMCQLMGQQGFAAGNDTNIAEYADFVDQWVTMFDPPAKQPGDACTSDADCDPRQCDQTSIGQICVQSCDPSAMPSVCPAGTVCTNVDGNNICAPPMAKKSGGCDVGGGAPVSTAALLFVALAALALRRRAAR